MSLKYFLDLDNTVKATASFSAFGVMLIYSNAYVDHVEFTGVAVA
jgi:hypothetical protein